MGHIVLEMISLGVKIAVDDEPNLLDQIYAHELEVDALDKSLSERAIVTIGFENPVAGDLLLLSATLAMVAELEKVGDEATKMATRICKLRGEFPYEMRDHLQDMARQAQANLRDGLRLYSQYSREAADGIVARDDVVDRSYKTCRGLILRMMEEEGSANLRQLLRCIEVFHALEHISDHASNIAKRLRNCYERFTVARIPSA